MSHSRKQYFSTIYSSTGKVGKCGIREIIVKMNKQRWRKEKKIS
jgi:hypothetical protein